MRLEAQEVQSIERDRRRKARRRRALWAAGALAFLCLLEVTTCWGRLTLLHWSAVAGSPGLARAAIQAGADPNRRPPLTLPPSETRPLYAAAGRGHAETVRLLLGAGADVDPPNSLPVSPLRLAAQGGYADICRTLVEAGANVCEWEADEGWTPLTAAVLARDAELVSYLLAAGASDSRSDVRGRYAEQVAEGLGEYQIAKLIRQYSPNNEDGTP